MPFCPPLWHHTWFFALALVVKVVSSQGTTAVLSGNMTTPFYIKTSICRLIFLIYFTFQSLTKGKPSKYEFSFFFTFHSFLIFSLLFGHALRCSLTKNCSNHSPVCQEWFGNVIESLGNRRWQQMLGVFFREKLSTERNKINNSKS